jgi:hypothetical protein
MRHPAAGQIARVCALVACAANLGFVAGLVVLIRQLGATTPLPKSGVLLLSLPLIGAAVACVLPALCLLAWRRRWWTVGERVAYSGLAAAAVAFATLLNYWKLLGFRY